MAGQLIGAAGGAGLGLINANQKKGEYNRQKQLAADIERNSPWTGVHGQMPQEAPNTFNSVIQGGLSGAMMGSPGGAFGSAPAAPNPMAGASPWGSQSGGMQQLVGGAEQSPATLYDARRPMGKPYTMIG